MAERLAALGLRAPAKVGDSAADKQERERKEKEERVREAEAEDARREQERQRRLADETITPPSIAKKPPPPPTRRGRSDSGKPGDDGTETVLREQKAAQETKLKAME